MFSPLGKAPTCLAIRQIISRAVVSDEVADIFAAAGLKKEDLLMQPFLTKWSPEFDPR